MPKKIVSFVRHCDSYSGFRRRILFDTARVCALDSKLGTEYSASWSREVHHIDCDGGVLCFALFYPVDALSCEERESCSGLYVCAGCIENCAPFLFCKMRDSPSMHRFHEEFTETFPLP